MVQHTKGTTPASETARVREAWASLCATIYASGNLPAAWTAATDLDDLVGQLQGEAAAFKGHLLSRWADTLGLTHADLAELTTLSRARITQIISAARKRGNPVTQPTNVKIKPPVVMSVVSGERGLLIVERRDQTPPVSFPGGDYAPGETIHETAVRRLEAETGLKVVGMTNYIGERLHPATRRHMIYVHAQVTDGEPTLGDPEDLTATRWVPIPEALKLMPDMFAPVKDYLIYLQDALTAEAADEHPGD